MWDDEGKKVLYIKSFCFDKNKNLVPRTLKERYEQIFNVDDLKKKENSDSLEVLKNLFQAVDVKNFGATLLKEEIIYLLQGRYSLDRGSINMRIQRPRSRKSCRLLKILKKKKAPSPVWEGKLSAMKRTISIPL